MRPPQITEKDISWSKWLPLLTIVISIISLPAINTLYNNFFDIIMSHHTIITYDKNQDKLVLNIINNNDKQIDNLTILIVGYFKESLIYNTFNVSKIFMDTNDDYLSIKIPFIQKYNDYTVITLYGKNLSKITISDIFAIYDEGKVNIVEDDYYGIPMLIMGFIYEITIIIVVFSLLIAYIVYVFNTRKKLNEDLNFYKQIFYEKKMIQEIKTR